MCELSVLRENGAKQFPTYRLDFPACQHDYQIEGGQVGSFWTCAPLEHQEKMNNREKFKHYNELSEDQLIFINIKAFKKGYSSLLNLLRKGIYSTILTSLIRKTKHFL